jgi:hypothetical protein
MSKPLRERIGFLHKERKIAQRTQKSMTASDALERVGFVSFPFFVFNFLDLDDLLIGLRTVNYAG